MLLKRSTFISFFKSFKKHTSSTSNDDIGLGIDIPKANSMVDTFNAIKEKLSRCFMKSGECGDIFQEIVSSRAERIPFFYQKEYVETEVHLDFLGCKTVSVCESTSQSCGTLTSDANVADRADTILEAKDEDSSETLRVHKAEEPYLSGKSLIPDFQLINNLYLGCDFDSGAYLIDFSIDSDPICPHFIDSAEMLGKSFFTI
ncbi:hypothetical protein AYI69_g1213 [Smittium culicis]|uniref:Uncharacterized protein n=1 Tax=Smittium culicis TaxID=133412 RepID=A0A1R1YQW9_9FUNG|nr:hypothetical protein AYI69_g1213 [Smittium culicis]